MGWFDEQIRERIEKDDELFSDSFQAMADAISGERLSKAFNDQRIKTKDAIDEILKYYNIHSREVPEQIQDVNEQLEYLMRPSGIMRRLVKLEKGWQNQTFGPLLATDTQTGLPIALIPSKLYGYTYYDPKTEKRVHVRSKNADRISEEAYYFYKPLPQKSLTIKDLIHFIWNCFSLFDLILVGLAALLVSLVGMIMPALSNIIYSQVVHSQNLRLLYAIFTFLMCSEVSKIIFNTIKTVIVNRISQKVKISTEAAMMMRILSLPPSFFKEYGSGDLANRLTYVGDLCSFLTNLVFTTGFTSLFSLVYIGQMFYYGPKLALPALSVILLSVIFSTLTAIVRVRLFRKTLQEQTAESALSYSLISGLQKIKLAGAEKRAFSKWAVQYAKVVANQYKPVIPYGTFITIISTAVVYYFSIIEKVPLADYYSFISAFGIVSSAFSLLVSAGETGANMLPILEMLKPILDSEPEIDENKKVVTHLSGNIELNNVSFRYSDTSPFIIDDLSLKIRPGQYVAIVGKTGCGKSTLVRLLLGFENPQRGAIYYDGQDMKWLDLKSLRQNIGTVMQDGKLFQGDIYSNITISAPQLTMDAAWKAAEMAGIAEDIEAMPMGMHTLISEGSGGVSGGQRQRLMIARAIAPDPKILMFDEATSALDNITQKKVSESLESLKCTRLVIAHRLSTIKECDRILVLDQGKIIEDGTYEELIAQNGFFAELVERQRVDLDG